MTTKETKSLASTSTTSQLVKDLRTLIRGTKRLHERNLVVNETLGWALLIERRVDVAALRKLIAWTLDLDSDDASPTLAMVRAAQRLDAAVEMIEAHRAEIRDRLAA